MLKRIMILLLCSFTIFSLTACEFKDDYIIVRKENTDEKPSGDKVNEIFDSEKMKDLMDKLKTAPKEISDKINEADGDGSRVLKELNDKADELTDALNNADLEGKSEEVKKQFDEISDKFEELKNNVEELKDKADTVENPIDKTKISNTIDEFSTHLDNLQRALDRVSSTR